MSILNRSSKLKENYQAADRFFSEAKLDQNLGTALLDHDKQTELYQKLAKLHLNNLSERDNSLKAMDLNLSSQAQSHNGLSASYKLFVTFAFITLLVVVGILVTDPFADKEKSTAKPKGNFLSAEIAFVEGEVEYRTADKGWVEAEAETVLEQGDEVRVLGAGKAIINIDDGSAIRLGNDSEVELTALDPNDISVNNAKGEVYARVLKSERKFTVSTGEEKFQAMGTAYRTINTNDEKGVDVIQSKVKVFIDDEKIAEVPEGKKYYFKTKDNREQKKLVNINLDTVNKSKFLQWNKDQDSQNPEYKKDLGIFKQTVKGTTTKSEEKPAPQKTTTNNTGTGISLSGYQVSDGIKLKWSVSGVDTSQGFKLVKAGHSSPVYPDNSYQYLDAGKRETVAYIKDGGTYYFKVCRYTGSGCDSYSNVVKVTAPKKEVVSNVTVTSISLSNPVGTQFNWSTTGNAANGYKLVWSTSPNPTYPGSSAAYQNPGVNSYTIPGLSAGTYYVRICAYGNTNGCTPYSNQVTVVVP